MTCARRRRRAAGALLAAATIAVAPGCGDDEPEGDRGQVEEAVAAFYANDEKTCERVTERYLDDIFGDEDDPIAACRAAAKAKERTNYKLRDVRLGGDFAEAEVEAGAEKGTIEVVRVAGDWKVDGVVTAQAARDESKAAVKSDEDAVKASLTAFYDAARKKDAHTYCGFLTKSYITGKLGAADEPFTSCTGNPQAVIQSLRIPDEAPDVKKVTVRKKKAEAQLPGGKVTLKKEGGLWKLEDFE